MADAQLHIPNRQGCRAAKFFDGFGSGKTFRLRLQLQVKRYEGSGSGQNVPVPAPHILNIYPLKSIKFDPLQKNSPLDKQWFYVCASIFIK